MTMSGYPEKLHIIPDGRKLKQAGKLADGRSVVRVEQYDPASPAGRRFLVTYVFDGEGELVDDLVSSVGPEGEADTMAEAGSVHAGKFGPVKSAAVDIKPFSISREGLTFGFVARELESDDEDEEGEATWVIEALPGPAMVFHAPFDTGTYRD